MNDGTILKWEVLTSGFSCRSAVAPCKNRERCSVVVREAHLVKESIQDEDIGKREIEMCVLLYATGDASR